MKRPRWLLPVVVVLVVSAGAAVWWQGRDGGEAPPYRSAPVEQGPLQAVVAAAGTVSPVRQVSVGSQVSGQIKELHADFNTEVKRGQLIARIDPESIGHRVRQAQADVDAARAQALQQQANVGAAQAALARARLDAANAARERARQQALLEQGFISPGAFDTVSNLAGTLAEQVKVAEAQLEVARAQAASARASIGQREAVLAQAKVDLDRTEIRSPVDGVVIKRSVDVGQTVAASLQAPELFLIARDLTDLQVEVAIDEADIGRVREGQLASFSVDAFPSRSFEGRVAAVRKAAQNSNNVVTYTVVVAFDAARSGPRTALLPGMTANVRIVTDARDAVVKLPNAALRVRLPGLAEAAPGGAGAASAAAPAASGAPRRPAAGAPGGAERGARGRVYVLDAAGRPQAVALRLGISDGSMTEVLDGALQPGQRVVTGTAAAAPASRTPLGTGPRPPF